MTHPTPPPTHCTRCGHPVVPGQGPVCAACATALAGATAPVRPSGISVAPIRVGRYVVEGELGRGGMGVVYRAIDPALQRRVAIKMVKADGTAERGDVERFVREARLAAKLRHPGIVTVHEAGTHEGQLYIAMDYVEGRNLEAVLSDRQSPAGAKAGTRFTARVVREMAQALEHAHREGVVHRDVKPQNVIIDTEDRARLTDFGLARSSGSGAFGQVTLTGEVVGTPSYMAPEQATGGQANPTPATDVWALGAVLYRGLVGRPPFIGPTPVTILQKVLDEEPESPRSVDPGIDVDLETICLRCLEKDGTRRYASAGEVAAELGRFLAHEPIAARPVGRADRAARWVRRNRTLATVFGVATLVVLGLSATVVTLAWRLGSAGGGGGAPGGLAAAIHDGPEKADRASPAPPPEVADSPAVDDPAAAAAGSGGEVDRLRAAVLSERGRRIETTGRVAEAWACYAGALERRDEPGTRIRLAAVRRASPTRELSESIEGANHVAVSDDIVAVANDGELVVLERSGRPAAPAEPLPAGGTLALRFVTDGALCWVGADQTIRRIGRTGRIAGAPTGDGDRWTSAAFDADGSVLAATDGQRLWLIRVADGFERLWSHKLKAPPTDVHVLGTGAGARVVAVDATGGVTVHGGAPVAHEPRRLGGIPIERVVGGTSAVFLASADGRVYVQYFNTTRIDMLRPHGVRRTALAQRGDQELFAAGRADGRIVIRQKGRSREVPVDVLAARDVAIVDLAIAPSADRVAALDGSGRVTAWTLPPPATEPGIVASAEPFRVGVAGIALDDEGRMAATTAEGPARVWDLARGGADVTQDGGPLAAILRDEVAADEADPGDGVLYVSTPRGAVIVNRVDGTSSRPVELGELGARRRFDVSSAAGIVVAAGEDADGAPVVAAADVDSGRLRWRVKTTPDIPTRVAIQPADGCGIVAVATDEGVIHLLDARTGETIWRETLHQGAVSALRWDPTGRWLASGSSRGDVLYRDLGVLTEDLDGILLEARRATGLVVDDRDELSSAD